MPRVAVQTRSVLNSARKRKEFQKYQFVLQLAEGTMCCLEVVETLPFAALSNFWF